MYFNQNLKLTNEQKQKGQKNYDSPASLPKFNKAFVPN